MVRKFARHPIINFLCSYWLTVSCLFLLMVLTFWGTLHQVQHGLYVTQHRMFNSWYFTALGFIPFPGGRLVLWVALVNVLSVTFFRLQYNLRKLGLWLVHLGIIVLIVSGGVTLHMAQESNLTLEEGQALDVAEDYHEWELALWTQTNVGDSIVRQVEAINVNGIDPNVPLLYPNFGVQINFIQFYLHCRAFRGENFQPSKEYLNASGIVNLKEDKPNSDPAKNFPGMTFSIQPIENGAGAAQKVLQFGAEASPTSVIVGDKRIFCKLRRVHYKLPILVKLLDFKKEDYVGTSMAKSYSSRVIIKTNDFEREVVISMNQPLRVDNFTFYQSSFSQSRMGETSTFAVVENPGRVLPYVGSIVIGLGLLFYFILMLGRFSKKQRGAKKNA